MSDKEQTFDGSPQATAPSDRSTTFQAVQGEPEHYSGTVLLVSAYAVLWTILLLWVGLVWRKQRALDGRIDDLERVLKAAPAQDRKSAR